MNSPLTPAYRVLSTLLGLTIMGVGILAALSPVPADQLTPAQDNLIEIADWMIKVSIGAILGVTGATGLSATSAKAD